MSFRKSGKETWSEKMWGRDNVGARGRPVNIIPKNKVRHFLVLLERLEAHYGSRRQALLVIDVNGGTIQRAIKERFMTQDTANKIYHGYISIK